MITQPKDYSIQKEIEFEFNQKVTEVCSVALHSKKEEDTWYIDSGCTRQMTSDEINFIKLKKENNVGVSFGNDVTAKTIGKGTMNIIGKAKAQNVLYVE